jgi:hypothetical protein
VFALAASIQIYNRCIYCHKSLPQVTDVIEYDINVTVCNDMFVLKQVIIVGNAIKGGYQSVDNNSISLQNTYIQIRLVKRLCFLTFILPPFFQFMLS